MPENAALRSRRSSLLSCAGVHGAVRQPGGGASDLDAFQQRPQHLKLRVVLIVAAGLGPCCLVALGQLVEHRLQRRLSGGVCGGAGVDVGVGGETVQMRGAQAGEAGVELCGLHGEVVPAPAAGAQQQAVHAGELVAVAAVRAA